MTPEKLWTGANKSMLGTHALNPGAESWHVPAGPGRWHTGSTGVQLLEAAALVSNSVFIHSRHTQVYQRRLYVHTPLVCDNIHYFKSLGCIIHNIMTSTTEKWTRGKRSRI